MEVDERPTEQYSDIGGLDKQIQEVSFPVLHPLAVPLSLPAAQGRSGVTFGRVRAQIPHDR